jgi:hypothetical protein
MPNVSDLEANKRYTITGVVDDVRVTSNVFSFHIKDASGFIRAVAFDEATEAFRTKLKEGMSFKFRNVEPRVQKQKDGSESLQIKIFPDCRVEEVFPLPDTRYKKVTLGEAQGMANERVEFEGIVVGLRESTISNDAICMKGAIVTEEGNVKIVYLHKQQDIPVPDEGVPLCVKGRMSSQGWMFVSEEPKPVENEGMATWFRENDHSFLEDVTVLSQIADLKGASFEKGARVELLSVVTSCGANVQTLQNGKKKRDIVVADASNMCVDVSVWDTMAEEDVKIGQVIRLRATVSCYRGISLSTNGIEVLPSGSGDTDDKTDALVAWWEKNCTTAHSLESVSE